MKLEYKKRKKMRKVKRTIKEHGYRAVMKELHFRK